VAAVELEKEAQRPHVVALVVCLGSSRVQEALQKKWKNRRKSLEQFCTDHTLCFGQSIER
jgi:hypothetical protein